MSTSNPINSYSFFLNSTGNNFTNGSSWTIPLPSNISVSNPGNSFSATITEASIPQTAFLISDQIGNNIFEFKLQVYVDKIINTTTGLTTLLIDKWMDCTDVQRQYIDNLNADPTTDDWYNVFAQNPNWTTSPFTGPDNWCDFAANKVIVASGNYTTNAALLSAVTTAMTTTMNALTANMAAFDNYYYNSTGIPILNIKPFTNLTQPSGADKSDFLIAMSNLWGVTVPTSNWQIEFKRYRLYVKGNEIFSMMGFTDRDITFDFDNCVRDAPYANQLNSVSYISPNIMVLNPNVNYYIAILNLSQTKSFVAIDGSAVTSQTFSSVFRSSSLPRSEVYYSLPTVIQIQDKNFNFLELCIKDYRNRIIPTVLFASPVYVTIVFQENLGIQSTPAINLQQLSDIDAVFWRQKELELQFELESFIRTKRK
jgi:hypothetical protein